MKMGVHYYHGLISRVNELHEEGNRYLGALDELDKALACWIE